MRLLESPSRLRRGAAPPTERASAVFVGVSSLLHAALLLLFVTWAKPPIDVAIPGGNSRPSGPRSQLVKLSPLRTYPAAEATPPEPEKSRPRPALVKRYTPGAPIVPRPERGTQKKSANDEAKSGAREVATTAAP